MRKTRIIVGDLVKIVTGTKLDVMLSERNASVIATVIACRHKVNVYRVWPANSPFTKDPYWVGGGSLELVAT